MPTERVETGPVQFDDDWPGLFIRGDNAIYYAFLIEEATGRLPYVLKTQLQGLLDLLRSCRVPCEPRVIRTESRKEPALTREGNYVRTTGPVVFAGCSTVSVKSAPLHEEPEFKTEEELREMAERMAQSSFGISAEEAYRRLDAGDERILGTIAEIELKNLRWLLKEEPTTAQTDRCICMSDVGPLWPEGGVPDAGCLLCQGTGSTSSASSR